MAVFDEKWQNAKASITERGIFMFNNDLLSDVSLVVRGSSDEGEGEPKKSKMAIPSHKFVLSSCSPVFFAMFCGELAEKSDSVDLPDCEYEGVLEMLRYMYSGRAELNENNVMQVLYVAKKYILPSLSDECVRFLRGNLFINIGNVFCVLSHALQYDENVLMDQCWELIDLKTEDAVKSEEFVTIERSLLEAVVKRDTLTIKEAELFKAVDLWATKECERQGLSENGKVKRKILGEQIVKEIRFPAMEQAEFASVVLGCQILTSEELIDIMKCFNSVVTSSDCFSDKQRIGACFSCYRYENTGFDDDEPWNYNSDLKECIDFKVDKDLSLYGIRMFGNKNSDYVVILKIRQAEWDLSIEPISSKSGTFSSKFMQTHPEGHFYGFDVLFDTPVALSSGIKYCVSATIDGPDSWNGKDGFYEVQCNGVTFTFSDFSERKDCGPTCWECGQFAAFLFRPT